MLPSQGIARRRKMLLSVVAVASGVTISCSDPGGIGLYNPGWDAAIHDAAIKKDANNPLLDATDDVEADDSSTDASGDTSDTADAIGD